MKRAFPPTVTAYVPVDEMLAQPRTRVLLALRWFDWVTAEELCDALELPTKAEDPWQRNSYQQVIARLVDNGLVLRESRKPSSRQYKRGEFRYRLAPDVDLTIPPPTLDAPEWRRGRKEKREAPTKRDARKEVAPLWLKQWRAKRRAA